MHSLRSAPVESPKSQAQEMSPPRQGSGKDATGGVMERVAKAAACPSCRGMTWLGPEGKSVGVIGGDERVWMF